MKRLLLVLLSIAPLSLAPMLRAQELRGAGATFAYPLYQKWFQSYEQQHPGTHFSYEAIGSTAGIAKLRAGSIDFAGSDIPVTDERLEVYPTVAGAVVPIYNLLGLGGDVRFTPQALAEIYLGTIRKWSDSALAKSNSQVRLPDAAIVPVHRSDGSGTTYVFTEYLAKTSPEWKQRGGTVDWPVGQGAEGNEGVARLVQQTPNSIGYVEFIYAIENHLSYGAVRNQAGRYVVANLDSISAAAATAPSPVSITDAPGKDAYPIAAFTYLLAPREASPALRDFLIWMLGPGQKQAPALGYAPLPEAIAAGRRTH
jgi:phosphate transport system substrate-binding protein